MAKQVTHICDWRDDQPDSEVCGKPAGQDVTANVGGVVLSGDLCNQHAEETIERLLRNGGLSVDYVKIDSKPRQTYVTKSGKIVTTREVRKWALAEGTIRSQHGRLQTELIQEYLDSH